MTIPQSLSNRLEKNPAAGLFPLIEIELKGSISFAKLISVLYNNYRFPHKLLKADVENSGKTSFGKLLLHLQGDAAENREIIKYFNKNKIQINIKGYAG
jgi:D-methionine transport system ATP-binding protein